MAVSRLTNHLWERLGCSSIDQIPTAVATVAHQCILDWFGLALTGSREPLSQILRDELAADAGACSLVGTDRRADPVRAALINGAAGHALDFDDSSAVMLGHPSVPVLPAVLAAAEESRRSGADVLTAYVVGVEVQSRVGMSISNEHYAKAGVRRWGIRNGNGYRSQRSVGAQGQFRQHGQAAPCGQAAERGLLAARLSSRGFHRQSRGRRRPLGSRPTTRWRSSPPGWKCGLLREPHRAVGNVSRPATDLCAQCEQLRAKYDTLAAPILGEAAAAALAESLSGLVAVADIGDMMAGSR